MVFYGTYFEDAKKFFTMILARDLSFDKKKILLVGKPGMDSQSAL